MCQHFFQGLAMNCLQLASEEAQELPVNIILTVSMKKLRQESSQAVVEPKVTPGSRPHTPVLINYEVLLAST